MTPKERVLNIYNSWYENNRTSIAAGKWNLVDENILLHPEQDTFRGLNLVVYLPEEINKLIDSVLTPQLKDGVGNAGWVVPDKGRHVTILDILPHNSGIGISDLTIQSGEYKEAINRALQKLKIPVLISFEGVFASPDGITIQGFPLNDGLFELREELRKQINSLGLVNLEEKKYQIETAHVALIKFISPMDGQKLIEVVDKLRDLPLGEFQVNEIVLNISPRYDKSQTVQVIEKFSL
jgi:2'-5' RNA ligase